MCIIFSSKETPNVNVPVFAFGTSHVERQRLLKTHLGMVFTKSQNMAKSAEHMLGPFMAGCVGVVI